MAESFANEYTTALSGSLTDSATNFTVMHDVPSGLTADFRVRVDNEFMTVTGISGSGNRDWTVTRESEDSSRFPAAAHDAGATVAHVLTVGAIDNLVTDPAYAFLNTSDSISIASASPATVHSVLDITFQGPRSGRAMVVGGVACRGSALSDALFYVQLDSGTDNYMGAVQINSSDTLPKDGALGRILTGLTPGQSYTAHFRWSRGGSGTLTIDSATRGSAQRGTWWMIVPLP